MSAPTRLQIDWTRCQARGACIELLSPLLIADQDGFPFAQGVAAAERTSIPVADEQILAARDAVALCPRLALSLSSSSRPR